MRYVILATIIILAMVAVAAYQPVNSPPPLEMEWIPSPFDLELWRQERKSQCEPAANQMNQDHCRLRLNLLATSSSAYDISSISPTVATV